MKKILSILIIGSFGLLAGCVTIKGMPGHLNYHQSTFDGGKELSMEPAWVYKNTQNFSGADFSLGLFWRSTMAPNTFVISAHVYGAKLIQKSESLQLNIDGRLILLNSTDQFTQIQTQRGSPTGISAHNESSRQYLISESVLDELLTAEKVKMRLILSNTYVEGDFSVDQVSSAKRGFFAFYEEYKKLNNK